MKAYSIVGMDHRKMEEFVKNLPTGVDAVLVREPNNPFDPCAVAVWIDGKHVGYIPKAQNQMLAKQIDDTSAGRPPLAMDAAAKYMPAKFKKSPNSGYPMVEV